VVDTVLLKFLTFTSGAVEESANGLVKANPPPGVLFHHHDQVSLSKLVTGEGRTGVAQI
jgi:hypothetical protein